jgi:hypothetical protein
LTCDEKTQSQVYTVKTYYTLHSREHDTHLFLCDTKNNLIDYVSTETLFALSSHAEDVSGAILRSKKHQNVDCTCHLKDDGRVIVTRVAWTLSTGKARKRRRKRKR